MLDLNLKEVKWLIDLIDLHAEDLVDRADPVHDEEMELIDTVYTALEEEEKEINIKHKAIGIRNN